MKQLNFNTTIFIGNDALDCLKTYSKERILIVTDDFLKQSHLIDYVTDNLNQTNDYHFFHDVVPDPTIENVVDGLIVLEGFKPTILIAFGGGSVIDAAKVIKFFAIKLGWLSECLLLAIPTTSGTGSEVTNFAVLTKADDNLKYPLVDQLLQPDKAILDGRLVKTVPPQTTADTGMDVLTHAIEAYVSTEANDFSDALAEKAIKLIFEYLERAYKNGDDSVAREKIHYASCLAGIAFNQASLGLCHGIAHPIGGKLHLAHGRINGILLPSIILYNGNHSLDAHNRYIQLGGSEGRTAGQGKVELRRFVTKIRRLRKSLAMPETFIEAGYHRDQVVPYLEIIAQEALKDPTTATNPVQPNEEEIQELILSLF